MLRQIVRTAVAGQRFLHLTPQRLNVTNKTYTPNNLEKKFLVWSGKYKTVNDIPAHISQEEMERTRNKVRIRLANIMILLTIVGCGVMVYSGKQAAKRGDSVMKQNIEWHKQYNEQHAEKPTTASN